MCGYVLTLGYLEVFVVGLLRGSKDHRVLRGSDARSPEPRILVQGAGVTFHERPPIFALDAATVLPPHLGEVGVADRWFPCHFPLPSEVNVQFLTNSASETGGTRIGSCV